jgi:cytochrome c oxidase subunit 1
LLAGSTFGFFAGLYYWFPKVTGSMLREGLGRVHFWLMVVGTNTTFLPMFWMGINGMPRRVSTYPDAGPLPLLNLISSIGAAILGASMIVFAFNVAGSLLRRMPAGDDPWQGNTLEWVASSPPGRFNFGNGQRWVPRVTSPTPLLDQRLAEQRT